MQRGDGGWGDTQVFVGTGIAPLLDLGVTEPSQDWDGT